MRGTLTKGPLAALRRDLVALGICGHQLIKVVLGGTLIPDLPAIGRDSHGTTRDGGVVEHEVKLAARSRRATRQEASLRVASSHHQAIDSLAQDLTTIGWAHDGLVEAVEAVDNRWLVGAQFHPENRASSDSGNRRIFTAFVDATRLSPPPSPVLAGAGRRNFLVAGGSR